MGNSIACCISQQRKRSKAHSHESTKASEQNSLKNLQILKKKSKLRSHYRARNRASNRRVLPTNINVDQEETTEQNEGVMRVKMVLTKKEVKELLSMLGSQASSHGGKTEQHLFDDQELEESERIAWTPSLQSIPESDDYFDH